MIVSSRVYQIPFVFGSQAGSKHRQEISVSKSLPRNVVKIQKSSQSGGIFKMFGWGDLFKLDQPFFFQHVCVFQSIQSSTVPNPLGLNRGCHNLEVQVFVMRRRKDLFSLRIKIRVRKGFFEKYIGVFFGGSTLPETNIAPARRPVQKEISLPTIYFQVLCMLVSGRVISNPSMENQQHCPETDKG